MSGALQLVARPHRNGGYAAWRTPARPGKGESSYELVDVEGEAVLSLGTLTTGMSDQGLAEFWGRALYRLRKYGLDADARREIAQQLLRAGVPLPASAAWPGATRPGWAAELEGLLASA
jgi:hypothetical protein